MSIDGYIEKVYRNDSDDLTLELAGRAHGEDGVSMYAPAGQSKMTIVNPTFAPPVGAIIWGGSGRVFIESETFKREYKRDGYTKLRELP